MQIVFEWSLETLHNGFLLPDYKKIVTHIHIFAGQIDLANAALKGLRETLRHLQNLPKSKATALGRAERAGWPANNPAKARVSQIVRPARQPPARSKIRHRPPSAIPRQEIAGSNLPRGQPLFQPAGQDRLPDKSGVLCIGAPCLDPVAAGAAGVLGQGQGRVLGGGGPA